MAQATRQHKRAFPLTLRPTEQSCKRIRRKLYYFGVDERAAYERHLGEAAHLHASPRREASVPAGQITIKKIANHFLAQGTDIF